MALKLKALSWGLSWHITDGCLVLPLALRARMAERAWLPSLGSPGGVWRNAGLLRWPVRRPWLPSHPLSWVLAVTSPCTGQLLVVYHLSHHKMLACCGPLSPAQEHVSVFWNNFGLFYESSLPVFWLFCVQSCAWFTCSHSCCLSSGFYPSRDDTYPGTSWPSIVEFPWTFLLGSGISSSGWRLIFFEYLLCTRHCYKCFIY